MIRSLARQRGGALAIAVTAMIPVLGLLVISMQQTVVETRSEEVRAEAERAENNALSALELAKAEISDATYAEAGYVNSNEVLQRAIEREDAAHLSTDADGVMALAWDRLSGARTWIDASAPGVTGDDVIAYRLLATYQIGVDDPVRVWVVPVNGLWFMLEAEARIGRAQRTARIFVRERDPFTRFSLFVDEINQPVSVSMTGDVHSNYKLRYFYGDLEFDGKMTSTNDFAFTLGAAWGNLDFNGGYDEGADAITLPDVDEVRERIKPPVGAIAYGASGDYAYIGSTLYDRARITLDGDTAKIQARLKLLGTWSTLDTVSISTVDRIYSEVGLEVSGDLVGRLSIATESTDGITITGSIRYVDGDGDAAYLDPEDVASYAPNPEYDGGSALGLIAPAGDIVYGESVPSNLEVHAALFTGGNILPFGVEVSVGSDGLASVQNYDGDFLRDNIFTLGSSISSRYKIRGIVSGSGDRKSGFADGAYSSTPRSSATRRPTSSTSRRPLFRGKHLVGGRTDD
ncbi:MAG: hypothetical protein R3F20_11205 [Planctomycetota bacterium]